MKLIRISMLPLVLLLASSICAPSSAKQLDPGTLLRAKFKLLDAGVVQQSWCSDVVGGLNQPTIYDPNDLAASLLSSNSTMMWQLLDRNTGTARPFRTIGEFRNHENRADYLRVDLNGDGSPEAITRFWQVIKGQFFTQMFVGQGFEPITYKTLQPALLTVGDVRGTSNFFLLDILELDGKPFVVALETVTPGIEWPDRLAYLVHMNAAMQPQVDCIMTTIIFGD